MCNLITPILVVGLFSSMLLTIVFDFFGEHARKQHKQLRAWKMHQWREFFRTATKFLLFASIVSLFLFVR